MVNDTALEPGTVWMGDEGHLMVSVPLERREDFQTEDMTRHRLHEGIIRRWPDANPEMLVAFVAAIQTKPLQIMEDPDLGHQIGVSLT